MMMGGKTYVISIPATWIKKYGIKKGDELDVEEEGTKIIINTKKGASFANRFDRNLTDFETILPRVLANVYKKGYTEIMIKSDNSHLIKKAEEYFNKYFIGFEVVKSDQNSCLIKQVAETSGEEFDNLLKRVFYSILSMQELISTGLKDNNKENLKEAICKDELINNLLALCKHLLNAKKYKNDDNLTYLYCICESLQNIADEHKLLAEYILKSKVRLKEEIKVYEEENNLFKQFYEVYYQFKVEPFIEASKKARDIRNKLYSFFDKKFEPRVLYSLIRMADLTHEMLSFKLSMEL